MVFRLKTAPAREADRARSDAEERDATPPCPSRALLSSARLAIKFSRGEDFARGRTRPSLVIKYLDEQTLNESSREFQFIINMLVSFFFLSFFK